MKQEMFDEAVEEVLAALNGEHILKEFNDGIFSTYVMMAVKPREHGSWRGDKEYLRSPHDEVSPPVTTSLDAINRLTLDLFPDVRVNVHPQPCGRYVAREGAIVGWGKTEALARCALLIKMVWGMV